MMLLSNEIYMKTMSYPTGWAHVVLNYIGPETGFDIYHNGLKPVTGNPSLVGPYTPPPDTDGRVVVGRLYNDRDMEYSSIIMDGLLFFNYKLNSDQIQMLYNSYS